MTLSQKRGRKPKKIENNEEIDKVKPEPKKGEENLKYRI